MVRVISSEKRRWWSNTSKRCHGTDAKENQRGSSLSHEETASDTSTNPGKFLNDFALPVWDNPVNASEHAVVKNVNNSIRNACESRLQVIIDARSSQRVEHIATSPIPTRLQPTPENMVVMFGDDSTNCDDITLNEMDFVEIPQDCQGSPYHHVQLRGRSGLVVALTPEPFAVYSDDLSLDVKTAEALQEEEIVRLALKRSLYDA